MIKKFLRHLRTKIFAGILVVLPIGLTFLVLKFVFNALDNILGPVIPEVPIYLFHRLFTLPGLGIISFFLMLYVIGMITTNVLGRKLVHWADSLVINIPVVKNIYPTIKQIVEAFHPSSSSSFKKVVLVEYPKSGIFALGFLTSEVSMRGGSSNQRFYSVYIPTNNLYLGHVALFKAEEVTIPGLTIEEGLKIILSGGTAFPPTIQRQDFKPPL